MQLTTDGIVLRDYKLEEDRILTILTDKLGVVTAFANGANRTRSRLASSTELLCHSRFVLFHNRDRYAVDKADSHRIFFGIREDLDKLALGSYLAELAGELSPHLESAEPHMRLLLGSLHYLENGRRSPLLLKPLTELRFLTLAGYMPNLVACKECGQFSHPGMAFFPQSGDLLCGDCLGRGGNGALGAIFTPPGALQAMRHIIYSPPEKLFAFTLSQEGLEIMGRICEYYLQYQVEKTFKSLEFYNNLRRGLTLPGPFREPPAGDSRE